MHGLSRVRVMHYQNVAPSRGVLLTGLFCMQLCLHNLRIVETPADWHAGQPGEQWTMFFTDDSGNALEFKAMTNPENLFAKYVVE